MRLGVSSLSPPPRRSSSLPRRRPSVAATELCGTVGPGFSIRLTHPDGSPSRRSTPAPTTIVVRDLAEEHNFHLSGPGVDGRTEVEDDRERHLDRDARRRAATRSCATRTRPRCSGAFVVGNPPPAAPPPPPTPAPAAEAPAHRRPGSDDHAAQRGGQGAPRAHGRHLHDRRPRPLEDAQRPPASARASTASPASPPRAR